MDDVFLKIVNLSISASWLILAVLVLRFVLKKAPKWVMPLLWGVVALRLICPFSIESALSLIPSAETIPSEIVTETREPVLYEQATLDIVTNPTLPPAAEVPVGVSRQQAQIDFNIYSVLWLAGMAALLVHALVSAGKLKRKLATAILLRDNIYESEFVDSPFVFGVIKPNIYLPMHMDEGTAAHVIAHERAHLARRDHWWKVLGYLVLALHWFNPLVWVAYILFCRDIELACDERVVKGLDGAARADYSQALLSCAAPKRAVAACPLAFGEGNIKTRVKSALHYKKPAFWVAAAAVLAVVIVAVCFLTNPKQNIFDKGYYQIAEVVYTAPEYPYDTTITVLPRSVEMTEQKDGWKTIRQIRIYGELTGESGMLWQDGIGCRMEKRKCYAEADDDSLFSPDGWRGGMNADSLRRGNAQVWSGSVSFSSSPMEELWVFRQKNGAVYLACVTDDTDAFRWVFRLAAQEETAVSFDAEYDLSYPVFDDPACANSYEEVFADFAPKLMLSRDEDGGLIAALTDGECYYRCSNWEEIELSVTNFDSLFSSYRASNVNDGWTDVNAEKLRSDRQRAWLGTVSAEDDAVMIRHAAILRQDELAPMRQWLLLQQADGSTYLVLGTGTGIYPYRWCIRLDTAQHPLASQYVLGQVIYDTPHEKNSYDEVLGGLDLSLTLAQDLRGARSAVLTDGTCYYPCSYWEPLMLTEQNFDAAFAFDGGDIWQGESVWKNGLSPEKLRQENSRAWRGLQNDADKAESVSHLADASQDDLLQLGRWLLLQQKDGSVYLALHENGEFRWVIELSSGISPLLAVTDLDGDGEAEKIMVSGATAQEPYRLYAEKTDGTELWSAELGLAHAGWDSYFLCEADGEAAILHYTPTMYQGFADYSYELFTLIGGEKSVLRQREVHFDANPDSVDPWPLAARKFAEEVNALIDQGTLLLSTLGGELHYLGDGTVIRCQDPSLSAGVTVSADIDNDGLQESISCAPSELSGYALCVIDDNGEELSRERMSKFDTYFLCRENGRDMLLLYTVIEEEYQGRSSYYAYYYGLYTFDGGRRNIIENANADIYLRPSDGQNGEWGEWEKTFAARVNELLDQSTLIASVENGALIQTGEASRWYCTSPRDIQLSLDSTTIRLGRKSWDFAVQYPLLSGFYDSEIVGDYLVVTGHMGARNELYVVFNVWDSTLLKSFPGTNLTWQGEDLSTAVYVYQSVLYSLNGAKIADLDLTPSEQVSSLAFAPDGVSIIATVSGKNGERKVTVTREGSTQQTSLTDWTEGDGAERTYFAPVGIEGNETFLATVGVSYRLEEQSDGTSRIAEITGAEGLTLSRYRRGWVSVDKKVNVLDAVIADDGKSADVTVQYYASLGGSGYQPYTAMVHIVAP